MIYRDGLAFRTVEAGDLEAMRRLRNDESTWQNLTDPWPITDAAQRAWFERLGLSRDRLYFVVLKSVKDFPAETSGEFIGIIRMDEIDRAHRSVRVGCDIVPNERGKGYGTAVYKFLLDFCFRELNMHRVWLCVLATNEAGLGLYRKAGFREEGQMRDAVYRGGRYLNYIVMSILEDEYRAK
jgi:RimJ/RimL family protein N-acetyltransferase